MRRYWKLQLALGGLCAVAGCNVLVDLLGLDPVETGASDLIAFRSEKELVDYFKDQVVARSGPSFSMNRDFLTGAEPVESPAVEGSGDGDAAPPQPADDGSFSGTTLQEEGVDESDVIKTDGVYVYMIDSSSNGDSVLRITGVAADAPLAVVSETSVEGFGRDIYLHDGKVVALTGAGGFYATPVPFEGGIAVETGVVVGRAEEPSAGQGAPGSDGDADSAGDGDVPLSPFGAGESGFVRPYTVVTIIDVSDPAVPQTLSTTRFEGNASSSRMIDGVLHLVLSNFQTYFVDVLPVLETGVVRASDVAPLTAGQVVPDFQQERRGEIRQGEVVSWESMFRPTDPDGFGVVTVVSLDVDADASFTAVGLVAEPGLIYASTQAIYLTDTQWNFLGRTRTTTDVYKLAVRGRGVVPVATGTVPGRVLNQYSMGEHEGNLRVASTIDGEFTFNGQVLESQNNVYVLAQEPGVEGLSVIGSVSGIAPGETIQSARFVGDRGYVVTFLQTDPLFTLDLADPRNPRVVGELEVPGFSTFLTPIDADHLLAVGRFIPPPGEPGPWAVQLSMFDVSDLANPVRRENVILGRDTGADSEALWNPKAFTYFAEGGMVVFPLDGFGGFGFVEGIDDDDDDASIEPDLLPAEEAGDPDQPPPDDGTDIINVVDLVSNGFRGVVVFDVSVESGLTERGRISTAFDEAPFDYPSFTRGVFIGDHVYAVTNIGIRSAATADVNNPDRSVVFERPGSSGPVTILEPVSPDGTITSNTVGGATAGPVP